MSQTSPPSYGSSIKPSRKKSKAEQAGHVLGYALNLQAKETCLKECLDALAQGESQHVVTLNPELIVYARGDSEYKAILENADWAIPDGAGIIWALQRQGIHHVKRLPGIEFSESLIAEASKRGLKIALIGGEEAINHNACKALQAKFPELNISYAHHGFF